MIHFLAIFISLAEKGHLNLRLGTFSNLDFNENNRY